MTPEEYDKAMSKQLGLLVGFARQVNELDLWGCVMTEARGMQDAGWDTSITAHEVFDELLALGQLNRPLTRPELRSALALYMQLAEAGGVYEGLKSMMSVIKLKPYSMWPFHDLVQRRGNPRRVIGPNANAMFKTLASEARDIGMVRLSELLEDTFRDDIRNGIAHADYIMWNDGLRLRRRNGGLATTLRYDGVLDAVRIGQIFFDLLHNARGHIASAFRPAREIYGRFSENIPAAWRVEWAQEGSYSLSSRAAPPTREAIAAYEKQQRINDKLGGKVMAVYVVQMDAAATALIDHMAAEGVDPTLVALPEVQMTALVTEVEDNGLWDARAEVAQQGVLLASPFGFRRITEVNQFASVLPKLPDEADNTVDEAAPAEAVGA